MLVYLFAAGVLLLLSACHMQPLSSSETDELPKTDMTEIQLVNADLSSDYVIIRPTDGDAEEIAAAVALRDAILAKTGVELEIKMDILKESAGYTEVPHELLVGAVNRTAYTAEADALVKEGDWMIAQKEEKLVVCGKTPTATRNAVDALIAALPEQTLPLTLPAGVTQIYRDQTPLASIRIGDTELADCPIILSASAKALDEACAAQLVDGIVYRYGVRLAVTKESGLGAGIYVGCAAQVEGGADVLGEDDAALAVVGNRMLIVGQSEWDALRAMHALGKIIEEAPAGDLSFAADYRLAVPRTETRRSMSYNILTTAGTIEARKPLVMRVIAEQLPDTLGLQEANPIWMAYLRDALGGVYASVGVGREGGDDANSGEFAALFYNKERLSLIDSGTFWLSDTPQSPSKYPDSKQKRICTWALLEDRKTGERFVHMNTHLDNKGADARVRQLEVLRSRLDEFSVPVVVSGDFNSIETSSLYASVIAGGGIHRTLVDAKSVAVKSSVWPTFQNFGASSSILDYFFFTEHDFTVERYAVLPRIYDGEYPSDHNAVCVDYTLNAISHH